LYGGAKNLTKSQLIYCVSGFNLRGIEALYGGLNSVAMGLVVSFWRNLFIRG